MSRQAVQRYKDVDAYVDALEQVYELELMISFDTNFRGLQRIVTGVIKGWDKDDLLHDDGPVVYHSFEVALGSQAKQQQSIIRALTEIARQCLELYAIRRTDAVPRA